MQAIGFEGGAPAPLRGRPHLDAHTRGATPASARPHSAVGSALSTAHAVAATVGAAAATTAAAARRASALAGAAVGLHGEATAASAGGGGMVRPWSASTAAYEALPDSPHAAHAPLVGRSGGRAATAPAGGARGKSLATSSRAGLLQSAGDLLGANDPGSAAAPPSLPAPARAPPPPPGALAPPAASAAAPSALSLLDDFPFPPTANAAPAPTGRLAGQGSLPEHAPPGHAPGSHGGSPAWPAPAPAPALAETSSLLSAVSLEAPDARREAWALQPSPSGRAPHAHAAHGAASGGGASAGGMDLLSSDFLGGSGAWPAAHASLAGGSPGGASSSGRAASGLALFVPGSATLATRSGGMAVSANGGGGESPSHEAPFGGATQPDHLDTGAHELRRRGRGSVRRWNSRVEDVATGRGVLL